MISPPTSETTSSSPLASLFEFILSKGYSFPVSTTSFLTPPQAFSSETTIPRRLISLLALSISNIVYSPCSEKLNDKGKTNSPKYLLLRSSLTITKSYSLETSIPLISLGSTPISILSLIPYTFFSSGAKETSACCISEKEL